MEKTAGICNFVAAFALYLSMKKLLLAIVLAFTTLAASAELKRYTNVLDKLPSAGYVGFVSAEFSAPGCFNSTSTDFGFTTTHGWMLRPTLFLGAGAGYIHNFRYNKGVIPVFAEGKLYFASQYMRRIYPHIGLRLGGQFATEGGSGFYSQLACGFRVPLTEKLALNVEVGPQLAQRYTNGGRKEGEILGVGGKFYNDGTKFGFFGRVSFEF